MTWKGAHGDLCNVQYRHLFLSISFDTCILQVKFWHLYTTGVRTNWQKQVPVGIRHWSNRIISWFVFRLNNVVWHKKLFLDFVPEYFMSMPSLQPLMENCVKAALHPLHVIAESKINTHVAAGLVIPYLILSHIYSFIPWISLIT
jgi:hypothetical protein